MLNFSLRQLEYFVVTAERSSIAAAARELNVSQPSLSQGLSKMEASIEVQLFVRHTARGVSLTSAGVRLLREARRLLVHAREFQLDALEVGDVAKGRLELGCFSPLAPVYIPGLIAGFTQRYPGADIHLHEGNQDELVGGLTSGRCDLALLYDLELPNEIAVEILAAFKPYVLLPKGHRLAGSRDISLAELADEPLILLDVPPSGRYFTGLFHAIGIEPRIAMSSPSLEIVRGFVGRDLGYSLLVTRPWHDHTSDGRDIVTRPLRDTVPASAIGVARLEPMHQTRLMRTFTGFCKSWFDASAEATS